MSAAQRSAVKIAGSTASASDPPFTADVDARQPSPKSGLFGPTAAIVAGVVAGAAVGGWWYLKHRNDNQVALSPSEICFGEVEIGQAGNAIILLYNRFTAPVVVTSISEPELFNVTAKRPLPLTVGPRETAVFRVTFRPRSVAAVKEFVTVAILGAGRTWLKKVTLNGRGLHTVTAPLQYDDRKTPFKAEPILFGYSIP
jgi:hypothetical protein